MGNAIVSKDAHYFARRRTTFRKHLAKCFPQTVQRVSRLDARALGPILHPHPERLGAEWLTMLRRYDVFAATFDRLKSGYQF
jgi:hypothetical protein